MLTPVFCEPTSPTYAARPAYSSSLLTAARDVLRLHPDVAGSVQRLTRYLAQQEAR